MRAATPLAAFAGLVAVLQPRAAALAFGVSASLALVLPRRVAVSVCVVLLIAALAGVRVDAVPPSPSARVGAPR